MLPILCTLLLPTVTLGAFADYTPYTYPDSMTQSELCGQSKPSFLCDPNNITAKRKTKNPENSTETVEEDFMEKELLYVRGETNCSCFEPRMCATSPRGYTISIAVVEKMRLDNNETTPESIKSAAKIFADVIRDRQSRGQCDDDLIIFLSARDQVVYTSMGVAVPITEEQVQRVSEQGEVFFRKMQYREGLEWMTKQYKHLLKVEKMEK
uniref:Uncharacterized protein n=1 Tax=Caenorhabditis japonica TaxID=281687 RepID=A0A8R1ICZ5_CAEJA